MKEPPEFKTRPSERGMVNYQHHRLDSEQISPKKFMFDDVGDENISDEDSCKNTPEI